MIFRNKYWFLSNMYPCNITYNGHTYKCVESAFQAQKDTTKASDFEMLDGFAAKKLGRRVNLRPDWERVKLQIMKEILKVKFSDNNLMQQLKNVSEPIVEENTWNDTYWGICNGRGLNNLGRLLEQIKGDMSMNGFIGITEAGDASRDLSWFETVKNNNNCLGAVLITKAAHEPEFQRKAIEILNHKPVIVHATCTGWGGTKMEPGTIKCEDYIKSIRTLIDSGFPADNIVLRVDPIFPNDLGLKVANLVLKHRDTYIPDVKRVRISIYDDYHKAREEMIRRGYEPIDGMTKWKNEQERRPSNEQVKLIAKLAEMYPDQIFECCAEPELAAYNDHFIWTGCISEKDCEIMGITIPANTGINGQNRFGCKCLTLKQELLHNKCRCSNNCAYCYWGR